MGRHSSFFLAFRRGLVRSKLEASSHSGAHCSPDPRSLTRRAFFFRTFLPEIEAVPVHESTMLLTMADRGQTQRTGSG